MLLGCLDLLLSVYHNKAVHLELQLHVCDKHAPVPHDVHTYKGCFGQEPPSLPVVRHVVNTMLYSP